jgi:hypothetical protein
MPFIVITKFLVWPCLEKNKDGTLQITRHSSISLLNIQSFNPGAHSASRRRASHLADCLNNKRARNHTAPFVALTETWLKSCINESQLDIPGYNHFRCDRGARTGGGVLLYSHEELPISSVLTYDDKYCQALICTDEKDKSVICVLYRPPEFLALEFRSRLDYMDQYIANTDSDFQLHLLGNFNLPIIRWCTNYLSTGGSSSALETKKVLPCSLISCQNLYSAYILGPHR